MNPIKKLKWIVKIGKTIGKIRRWSLTIFGSFIFLWEIIGAVPDLLVILIGVVLALVGLRNNGE